MPQTSRVTPKKGDHQSAWLAFVSWHKDPGVGGYEWSQGIRAALGISIPTAIGLVAEHLSWGILAALATFWTLMCDVGGAYRQKAIALTGSGLAIVGAYIFGAWITRSVPGYIGGLFCWAFAAALLGAAGSAAAQAGLITTTIIAVAVVLTAPNEFWVRLLLCAGGILWALALTLALWPVHAFSPLFQAIAKSCDQLGNLLDSVWEGASTSGHVASNFRVALAYDGLLASLEQSRNVWAAVRARRAGPSIRSIQLLELIERIDHTSRAAIAFRGVLNLLGCDEWFASIRPELQSLTKILAELARDIGNAVVRRGGAVDSAGLTNAFDRLAPQLKGLEGPDKSLSSHELRRTIESLVKEFRRLATMVAELKTGDTSARPPEPFSPPKLRRFEFTTEIRNSLSFRSNTFRHALRLGLVAALAGLIASAFHLARGYWIPVTVIVVLKPNFGGTIQRAAQRITGTIGGALLAALLLWWIHDPWLLLVILAFLSFATFTLRSRNYGLFSLALTPMIMVMLDLAHPGTVEDSFLRIIHTMIGGGLAIVCGYLLFPIWTIEQLPAQLAEAFRADSLFLQAILALGTEKLSISEMRKRSGLAVANATNAAQRLLTEPSHVRGNVEPLLASISFCRDTFYSLSAIAHLSKKRLEQMRSEAAQGVGQQLSAALMDLATNVETGMRPKPLPVELASFNGWSQEGMADQNRSAWVLFYLNALIDHVKLAHDSVTRLAESRNAQEPSSLQQQPVRRSNSAVRGP